MHPQFQDYNAMRHPAWRYERALDLLSARPEPLRPMKHDGKWVAEIWHFLQRYDTARTELQKSRLFTANPGLYYAYQLYSSPDERTRLTIEARILAGMDDESIAELYGTLPSTIAWYEMVFFNVRDRLNSRDWVQRIVLIPAILRGIEGRDEDAAWKLFGYFGGPAVLDALMFGFKPKEVSDEVWNQLGAFFAGHTQLQIEARLAAASHTVEINRYNFADLMSAHARLKDLEMRGRQEGLPASEYRKNVEAVLATLEVLVGEQPSHELQVYRYDKTVAELRAAEQHQLASGKSVAGLEGLADETFPEPNRCE